MTNDIVLLNGGFNNIRSNSIDDAGFVFLWQNEMYVVERIDPDAGHSQILTRKLDTNHVPKKEVAFTLREIDMRKHFFSARSIKTSRKAYIVGKMEKIFSEFRPFERLEQVRDKDIFVGHVLTLKKNTAVRLLIEYASQYCPGKFSAYYRYFDARILGPVRKGEGIHVNSRDYFFEERGQSMSYDSEKIKICFDPMLLVGKMEWKWVFQKKWYLPGDYKQHEFQGILTKEQAASSC